jgi:hypothetical protein
MYKWNRPELERKYERIKQQAIKDGFTEDDLITPYLDKEKLRTKSLRIHSMIKLAYTLGHLRGIKQVDEGYTPVTLS